MTQISPLAFGGARGLKTQALKNVPVNVNYG